MHVIFNTPPSPISLLLEIDYEFLNKYYLKIKYQCLIEFHQTSSHFLFYLNWSLGFNKGCGHGSESVELF